MKLQDIILNIYLHIKDNYYLCRDDIAISKYSFNSTLLFGILTTLVKGKELIYGEYGLGKTTSSENILSLIYSYPKEVMLAATLKGNPEQTEEKMIGRPDLGKLSQGIEKVIWSDFVLVGPKIIDELNRLPVSKQNILLEGIDRGIWKYLNETIYNESLTIFATSNYKDSGNNDIVPPLLDRFDMALESKHPGINNLRYKRTTPKEDMLSDKEISAKMLEAFMSDDADSKKIISDLRSEYRHRMRSRAGIELMSDDEISLARNQISSLNNSRDSMLFYDFFTAELSSCQLFGQKRSNDVCPDGCHYSSYLCNKVTNCLSMRSDNAIRRYSAAVAWLLQDSEIKPLHISAVLPYAIWHKIRFRQEYMDNFRDDTRDDVFGLHVARKAVEEISRRFKRNKSSQDLLVKMLSEGKISEAVSYSSSHDHPVFSEYLKL